MNVIQMMRDLCTALLVTLVAMLLLWARWYPDEYGRWLQQIDTARFEMMDCDCTEPLE